MFPVGFIGFLFRVPYFFVDLYVVFGVFGFCWVLGTKERKARQKERTEGGNKEGRARKNERERQKEWKEERRRKERKK